MARTLTALVAAILCAQPVLADVWQARYGVAETFNFPLFNADGTLDVDEADGGTEVSLSCNEGAETTATNDFADEGTFYSIALTATEMQCERIAVVIAATTTHVFFIETYANASAMTPTYEANVASVTDGAFVAADFAANFLNAAKIDPDVTTELQSGLATASALATVDDFVDTEVATLLEALVGLGQEFTADSGTTTTIVDAALTQATNDWFAGQGVVFTSGTLAGQTACITAFTAASDTLTITTVTATVGTQTYYILPMAKCQTGDSFARIGVNGAGLSNIDLPNQTMDITGNITGNLSGTVGTVNALANNSITDAASASDFETRLTTQATSALNSYDPPTRAEATADKDEILSSIGRRTTITVTDQDTFTLAAGATFDNAYQGWGVKINDAGSQDEWLGKVESYVGSSKTVELNRTSGFMIATGDTVTLYPAFLYEAADTGAVNCVVDTANFAGSATTLACDLTDKDGNVITLANGKWTGKEILITSGAQLLESRYIFSTTWDGTNNELQITLDRALPATLADNVTAIIR